ncbi:hypothetical protein [Actinoplanes solisilvae]|uniref:hypothetical protein n=1 Tax=Actinoplanes solisilvae TaxID=2486853 RepID=UPI000FDBDAD7|nr:hypothetical protein [Actinoplanes solisilvae]
MTAVLEPVEAAPIARPSTEIRRRPPVGRRFPRWPAALLPWLFPAVALVVALLNTGVSGRDIALYGFYFAVDIVLPGTLVHRLLRGSRGNLPEDLGLGAATGLLLMIGGWALTSYTDKHTLMPWWPALIVVPFLAVPRLHRHWRVGDPRPLPLRWSWIVAAGLLVLVAWHWPGWTSTPLPPQGGVLYQDLYYHLALVHEMMRAMPFQVPQVVGEPLRYHFLSDADMAAASLVTKIDPAVVLLRLWIVPIAGTAIFALAALTRELSGKWWAGAVGGVAAVVGLPLTLGSAVGAIGGTPISFNSPSLTYALPLLTLLVMLATDVLRGRPLRWAWLLVFPLALACAGAKSSALPPLLAGLAAAAVIVLFGRLWRRLLPTIAFGVLTVAAVALGFRLFAGGGAGTLAVQPLSILFWSAPYAETLGLSDTIDGTRFLPLGVEQAGTAGRLFLAWLLIWWFIMQAPRLGGVIGLAGRIGRDPSIWLLNGMAGAGAGAMFLLWHPSASQVYFFGGALSFGTVAVAVVMARLARSWRPVLAGVLVGGIWVLISPQLYPPTSERMVDWVLVMAEPLVRTAIAAVGVAAIALILRRRWTGRTPWRAIVPGLLAAVLGAGLAGGGERHVTAVDAALAARPAPLADPSKLVLTGELVAAKWLDDNAGRDDVVATNVHCVQIDWNSICDSRAFWVAAVGGRRTVLESWGYTDEAVSQDGVNGERYSLQPPADTLRYVLNQRVFTDGQADDVAELRRLYGVKWLFADGRAAGGVSPRLADLAVARFASGPVTVYELP